MVYASTPIGGPGDGLFPPEMTHRVVKNTSGSNRLRGNVLMFDMANATTGLSMNPGGNAGDSLFNTVIDVTAGGRVAYPLGVLEEDIADDGTGKVTIMGIVRAKSEAGVAAGDPLTINTTNMTVTTAGAATDRIVGIALEAIDATETGFVTMLFQGWGSLGTDIA